MILRRFVISVSAAVMAAVAFTPPLEPFTLQLVSQNVTASSAMANNSNLGRWPQNIFTKPLGWGISVQVRSSIPYHPVTPTQEFRILSIIEAMEDEARRRYPIYPKTVTVKHYLDTSGPIIFEMNSTNAPFTGLMIAGMLKVIWDMILEYGGPASLFAHLIKEGGDVGFIRFELGNPVNKSSSWMQRGK